MFAQRRLIRLLRTLCLLAAVMPSSVVLAAPQYRLTDLGSAEGETRATGVNAHGVASGTLFRSTTDTQAFRHDGQAMELLGPTTARSTANGINANGQVTGSFWDGMHTRAYRLDGSELIALTPPGRDSVGRALNDLGHVVGSRVDEGGRLVPFAHENGLLRDLSPPSGALPNGNGEALAINQRAEVAGFVFYTDDSENRVLVRTAGQVGLLPAPRNAVGYGINGNGDITGQQEGTFAFMVAGGVVTDLGVLAGFGDAATQRRRGLALNDHDQVVGFAELLGANQQRIDARAFLYSDGAMHDLNALLDDSGEGWLLTEATDINDKGVIVGNAWVDGRMRAFLLSPVPEPETALLCLAALGFCAMRRPASSWTPAGLSQSA